MANTILTNEDKIRQMSRWELAEFIFLVSSNAIKISVCTEECKSCIKSDGWCISEIGEWLMASSDEMEQVGGAE